MPRYKPKGKPTAKESAHMADVASLPCCISGVWPVQVHHITECGRRLGNPWVLPLSVEEHTNINSVPFLEQLEYCRKTYKKLGKVMPEPITKIVRKYE